MLTGIVLVGGLFWMAVARRQLVLAGETIVHRTWATILVGLLVDIALPLVGLLFLFSVLGSPIGLAILLWLIPALAVFGFVVTATLLGRWLVDRQGTWEHPYLSVVVGTLLLCLLALIPFIGLVVFGVAAGLGAGAIVVTAWSAWRHPVSAEVAAPPATALGPA
jgi:hypothetical protein